MHPKVYETFVALFEKYQPNGGAVLEIGATTNPKNTLLTWFSSTGRYDCTGIDLEPGCSPSALPYRLREMDSNDLSEFPDASFRAVISNAVLEHDRSFWLTLSEVRRVLAPGGYFFVGTPGYPAQRSRLQRFALRPQAGGRLSRVPQAVTLSRRFKQSHFSCPRTLWYHATPRDYYRFSEDAFREVFLEGMECLTLVTVLNPVRLIAVGRRIGQPSDSG
jgi:SAM-dependent methyltransferase